MERRGEERLFPQNIFSHNLMPYPSVRRSRTTCHGKTDGRTDGLPLRPIAKQLACSLALLPSRLFAPSPLARARGVGACIF